MIHNPRSRRNRRDGKAFAQEAGPYLGDRFLQPRRREEMLEMLTRMRDEGVDTLGINGGDGTVSSVMSAVHAIYPADRLPRIAIFPSGNTNLIAGDVGFRARGIAPLRRLIEEPETLRISARRPLRLSWPDGSRPDRLGMFGGSSGYARAIRIAHSPHVLRFAPHNLAVAVTLLSALGGLLISRRRRLWLDGERACLLPGGGKKDRSFVFLATGLQHLDNGIWPFWRKQSDPAFGIHYLNVTHHPRRLAQALGAMLRGRAPDWLRAHPDYDSGCTTSLEWISESDFVLDGEIFPATPDCRVCLDLGPRMIFVQD